MANTKSAIKEIRVARARHERNQAARSQIKTSVRKAEELLTGADKDATIAGVKAAESALDRAASRGILHPKSAARRKGRLAKKLNKANTPKTA